MKTGTQIIIIILGMILGAILGVAVNESFAEDNPFLRGLNHGGRTVGGVPFVLPHEVQRVEIDVRRKPSGLAAMSEEDFQGLLKSYRDDSDSWNRCENQIRYDWAWEDVHGSEAMAKKKLARMDAGNDECFKHRNR